MGTTLIVDPAIPADILESNIAGRIISKFMATEKVDNLVYLQLSDDEFDLDDVDSDEPEDENYDIEFSSDELAAVRDLLDGSSDEHGLAELHQFALRNKESETAYFDRGQLENLLSPLLQQLCIAAPDELPYIQIQGSYSEYKPRFGDFGGFASFITADGVREFTTHDFLNEQLKNYEIRKSMEGSSFKI